MRGRSYTPSPPPRGGGGYGRRGRSPSPRGCYGGGPGRDLHTAFLFVIFAMTAERWSLFLLLMIEPIPSGNLPPGFDPSTCRSVYIGNIHTQVTEPLLHEVFSSTGPTESCKLIRKDKSSYGFVHYFDRRSAAMAILSLNGRHLFGQPIKVNWAYASGQREDTSGHFNIFMGDLSPEVTDATLYACFSVYPSCS